MARPNEAKRAAVLATLARYSEADRPGDRAVAREVWEDWGIKVSPPFVYFMRTGQRRGEAAAPAFYEDEGEALNMPAGGVPWAWLAGLVAVVALVLVLAWASRQRQQHAASDATLASPPDATSAAPGGLALA